MGRRGRCPTCGNHVPWYQTLILFGILLFLAANFFNGFYTLTLMANAQKLEREVPQQKAEQ